MSLVEKKQLVIDDDEIEGAVPDRSIGVLRLADRSFESIDADPDAYFQVRHLRRLLIAYEEQFRGTTDRAYVAVRDLQTEDSNGSQTILTLQQSPEATEAVGLAAVVDGGDDS